MKQPVKLPFKIGSGRDFPKTALRMQFFKNKDASLSGEVWFGKPMEGPPGHVHGGVSAYVLDEAMGSAAWVKGYPSVAREIQVKFLEMTPQGQDLQLEAMVTKVDKKSVTVYAKIFDKKKIYSESTGTFHRVARKLVAGFLQSADEQFNLDDLQFPEDD